VEQVINVTRLAASSRSTLGAKQVFLTSHNPSALDAFDLFDDDVRVFVVSRSEQGHSSAERLRPQKDMSREQWQLVMNGRNLSQVWLDGEIPGALGGI
jgi:hypothetical protein